MLQLNFSVLQAQAYATNLQVSHHQPVFTTLKQVICFG